MNQSELWWKSAVIYQIYPRSFKDTSGDGIGDLQGIIQKLPYLKELGINAIWVNPFFLSPMDDFGYDIQEFYSVDPIFGSNFDMLKLIKECHKHNIKIILDMVFNHTSDQHPWFIESRSNLTNKKRDWYVWNKGIPNNWESIFHGSSWTECEISDRYYYHSFLPSQPDLNLRNPEVVKEVLKILEYYLEIGVDGFRLDAVNTFYEDSQLRDNPDFNSGDAAAGETDNRVYTFDHHLNYDLLDTIKAKIDEYPDRFLVGEVNKSSPYKDAWKKYFGDEKRGLDTVFNFDLLYTDLSASKILSTVQEWEGLCENKWPSYALGSHDQTRFPTRIKEECKTEEQLNNKIKMLSTFLLTVRGTPFIYYGEEIGMKQYEWLTREQIKDPIAIRTNYKQPGRDGCRTPMPWNKEDQAGFSQNTHTWLPIHENFEEFAVSVQQQDPSSIYNHYKTLINVRQSNDVLQLGDIAPLHHEFGPNDLMVYSRSLEGQSKVITVLNFSQNNLDITSIINQNPINKVLHSNLLQGLTLLPYGFAVYESNS